MLPLHPFFPVRYPAVLAPDRLLSVRRGRRPELSSAQVLALPGGLCMQKSENRCSPFATVRLFPSGCTRVHTVCKGKFSLNRSFS